MLEARSRPRARRWLPVLVPLLWALSTLVLSPAAHAAPSTTAHINFGASTSPSPAGYTLDKGDAFSTATGYGWIDAASGAPRAITADGRYRPVDDVTDVRFESYIHFQKDAARPVRWQYQLPSGIYLVTVGTGDTTYLDSTHRITAESSVVIDRFTPTAADRFRERTVAVSVTDGFLTLSADGGTNTKIDWLIVEPVGTTPTSTTTTSTSTTTTSTTSTTRPTSTTTTTAPVTTTTTAPNPTGVTISSPDDAFAVRGRLAFASAQGAVKPPRSVTVRNGTAAAVNVTNVRLTSYRSQGTTSAFRLAANQATSFSIPAGQTRAIAVQFTPPTASESSAHYASLRVSVSGRPELVEELSGLAALAYYSGNEPILQQILAVVGYDDIVANVGNNASLGSTRNPVGSEILAPYFSRADASRPVEIDMVARYRGPTVGKSSQTGWNPRGTNTKNQVLEVNDNGAAGTMYNQTVMPTTVGTKAFVPSGQFAIYSETFFTDDTKNGGNTHTFRVYPARASDGFVEPNTYVLALDFGLDGTDSKNYDFQDTVYVLKNVVPTR